MMHTLKKAKNHLHSINRFLMVKGNTPWNSVRIQVEKLWGALHTYRLNTERSSETEQLLLAIDKAAGQASRLHDVLLCSESDKVTNEFMVLRKYVELVEKGMVRYWHWVDTGVRAK
ncbi:MAG: hypothetical protein ACXVOI_11935, partial [Tumebacillaceae bacterium]